MNKNSTNYTTMDSHCHHPVNDLIEAVAFGFANEEEVQRVTEHVANCEICARALDDARFAAQALPLSVEELDTPETLWAGIEERINVDEPPVESASASPGHPSPSSPSRMYWAAAALLALLTLAGGILLGRTIFVTDSEPDPAPVVEVSITDPEISASGSVHYFADQGVILMNLENLPSAPEGYVYQVWMIEGDAPISVGVLPTTNRFAAAGDPADFDLMAVTLEEGPIGSDQPTSDPLVIADLEPLRDN